MNFALLGDDPRVGALVRAIGAQREHALTHVVAAGDGLDEIVHAAPAARVQEGWGEALLGPDVDAVIVAGHRDDVLDAARQLAAASKPLVVLADARQGLPWVYELTLARDEAHVPLVPVFWERLSAAAGQLRGAMAAGAFGRLLHLQLDRTIAVAGSPPLLTAGEIERALLSDVDLLRSLGGDYDQITALYTGAATGRISRATVTLAGSQLPEALWSLRPDDGAAGFELRVAGESGHAELRVRDETGETVLTINGERQPADDAELVGDTALRHLERSLAGEPSRPDWTDLTRALEIVDAARRSVRRRRTIDLHFETTSERSLFKTQMTALGCGVLVLTFFAVVAVLLIGTIFNLDPIALRIARAVAFLPLFVYLILQLLLFVTRPPLTTGRDEASPRSDRQE